MPRSSSGVRGDRGRWATAWLLGIGFALVGCNDPGVSPTLSSPVPEMVSNVMRVAEHASCPGSAVVATSGYDWNDDGTLDADEIESTEVLCDDEAASCTVEDGTTTVIIRCPGQADVEVQKAPANDEEDWLVVITPGAPQEQCPAGGYTVRSGRDVTEPKGVLDDNELETTAYACHAYCGDDAVDEGLGEECDDGNTAPGDGCDEHCRIEPSCAPPTPDPACPEVSYFVDSVLPGLLSTAGGTLTLQGAFPEASPEEVVATWVDSGTALEVTSSSGEEIHVNVPAGVGNGAITLAVAGWPISYLSKEIGFDGTWTIGVEPQVSVRYAPPVLSRVFGCTDEGVSTTECAPEGGTVVTLDGSNFGASAEAIQVLVGGQSCGSVTMLVPHVRISCVLPARNWQAFDLPVQVTVGGQSSTSDPAPGPTVSYEGPSVLGGTLSVNGSVAAEDAYLPDTLGGHQMIVDARGLGTVDPADVSVRFQHGNHQVFCAVTALTPLNEVDVRIECTLEPGVGANLAPVVSALGVASRSGTDRLHHPKPVIHPDTLRFDPVGSGSNSLIGSRSSEEDVYFEASHLGTNFIPLVTYGPPEQPDLYACESVDVDNALVRCRTALGSGGPYVFSLRMPGDTPVVGTDTFTYPEAPVLTRVTGCQSSLGNVTVECPTPGAVELELKGEGFGPHSEVRVGSALCTGLRYHSADLLTCTLPPGVGDVPVTVEDGFLRSAPLILGYARPRVTAVRGCVDLGNTTTECLTAGGVTITIEGNNFGSDGAVVLVGPNPCNNVQHSLNAPHERLTCELPAGAGTNQMLRVVNGGMSEPFAIHYGTP